jgi:hypothetical protein
MQNRVSSMLRPCFFKNSSSFTMPEGLFDNTSEMDTELEPSLIRAKSKVLLEMSIPMKFLKFIIKKF